MRYNKQNLTI